MEVLISASLFLLEDLIEFETIRLDYVELWELNENFIVEVNSPSFEFFI